MTWTGTPASLFVLAVYCIVVHCQIVEPQIVLETSSSDGFSALAEGAATNCQIACAEISLSLTDAIFIGQTGNYNFWDAKQREIVPACRVEPNHADDIALILKTVVDHSCHFAVKSGGHERAPGASNADGGITIDLVRLKSLTISEDRLSITIGAGWRWGELYQALEEEKLMVLGGRLGEVGVGGLLHGGGISYFSNEYGLACDSILSYEFILPNATTIVVDQVNEPQLFQALRGSPPMNFGIVSKFTLEAFPHNHVLWTGTKLVAWEDLTELLEANNYVTTNAMNQDPHIAMMNIYMCNPRHRHCFGMISAQHTSHNSSDSWPASLEVYAGVNDMPRTSTIRVAPVANVTGVFESTRPEIRHRTIYATFTYRPSVVLEKELLTIFREEALLQQMRNVSGFVAGVIMHPFSETMTKTTRKRGGNSFSWSFRDPGSLTVLNISWQWNDGDDDNQVYESSQRTMERFEQTAKTMGLWHPYKYINYAEASQDVWEGLVHVRPGLEALQRQLDPRGVFTTHGLAGGVFQLKHKTLRPGYREASESRTRPPSLSRPKGEL